VIGRRLYNVIFNLGRYLKHILAGRISDTVCLEIRVTDALYISKNHVV